MEEGEGNWAWFRLSGAPGCGRRVHKRCCGTCARCAGVAASSSSDPAPHGAGAWGSDTPGNYTAPGSGGVARRLLWLPWEHEHALMGSGPAELHSTPFRLLRAHQPGQQGSCLFLEPSGLSCALLVLPSSGVSRSAGRIATPPLAAFQQLLLLMTNTAGSLFSSAVRGISRWACILAVFPC